MHCVCQLLIHFLYINEYNITPTLRCTTGTPSLASLRVIRDVIAAAAPYFDTGATPEISIEVNPSEVSTL